MSNWYYKKKFVSQKIFIIKCKNEITNEIIRLTPCDYKDYQTAVADLKSYLLKNRIELMNKQYNQDTDMTEILKGFIEVHKKLDGKVITTEPIKVYNYNF